MKRTNGSGTLYRRTGSDIWYTRILIGGKWVRKSTGETDRAKAEKILDEYATGHDLPDDARLAAVEAILKARRSHSPTFAEAWDLYTRHPKNADQSQGAQGIDLGRWRVFTRWAGGYQGGDRCRINQDAAHPEVERLEDVTQDIASEFVAWARGTVSPSTVNRYIRVCRRIWDFAKAERNPWVDFPHLKTDAQKRRRLTPEELTRLIESATGEMRTLFVIGAYTGLRLGDAAHVTWEQVDAAAGIIRLRPHKTIYSAGTWVHLPMHRVLSRQLGKPKKRGYVTPEMASWPQWKLSDAAQAHFEVCGLAERRKADGYKRHTAVVGFHSLRSTFVSLMVDAGVPLAIVRALVGHVDEEITLRYYRMEEERARAEIDKLPDFTA
ncbi:MAG: tyrosine-type recombinase/integrase [Kiritimatiellia bacterium]